ncbi:MAG: hypothetical protein ABH845_06040 [Candidatus Omnitrophota bacterium]
MSELELLQLILNELVELRRELRDYRRELKLHDASLHELIPGSQDAE